MKQEKLPITLVVVTLNEEANLRRCLQSADFCEHIIIVDSGSTDRTLDIAKELGAEILARNWTGFADQKNFGVNDAQTDWVLCLDADEEISPELYANILALKNKLNDFDGFELNRHAFYLDRFINHSGWYPEWRLFLYRKSHGTWGGLEPHVEVQFRGRKSRIAGDLYHYTYRDIQHHVQKSLGYARTAADAMNLNNRRATFFDLRLRAPWAFFRSFILKRGFFDGFAGLVIAWVTAYYTFLKYAYLRELNTKSRKT
ncbi:glycosyltransferase family 2 protein [bacterium]|nr:glycosyltransferase family 2 protein [bacterium]